MNAYAAIHVARKQLGLDDDTARDIYERATGKRSLKAMNDSEREAVVSELRRRGFKRASSSRRKLSGPFAKKLQALWIAGWNLGVFDDRDDAALIAFVRRQTGLDHIRFLQDAGDAEKAIEAIKAWMAREAGVDWSLSELDPAYARKPGFKIAWAQWLLLGNDAGANSVSRFWSDVRRVTGQTGFDRSGPSDMQWIAVMNRLGESIRSGGARKVERR